MRLAQKLLSEYLQYLHTPVDEMELLPLPEEEDELPQKCEP